MPTHLPFIIAALLLSTVVAAQAPLNDNCTGAIPITCGQTTAGSTATATPDPGAANCGTSIQAAGVWYTITGSDEAITLSTCSDFSYDTRLNVYRGTCSGLQCVAGNDDGGDCGLGSTLAFAAEDGVAYYILVQGYQGETGEFELTAGCAPLSDDHCQGATPITCNMSLSGSTSGATQDVVPFCETSVQAPGVWYTFSGVSGLVHLSTCESLTYDSRINVYSGTCGALVCVIGNDDTDNVGTCSTVDLLAESGTTYHVLVQGYDGQVGDFLLEMACPTCGTPGGVSSAASDESAFIHWNSMNTGASYEIEYGPLGFTPGTGATISGPVTGPSASAQIDGLDPATEYAFYLREVCGPDDHSARVGVFVFQTLDTPPAANGVCSGAIAIACGGSVEGDTQASFALPGEHCGAASVTAPGLWYTFTGNGAPMTLSTCGEADFDTKISVYEGVCGALVCVAGGDDAPGCAENSSEVTFQTVSDIEYAAFVHAYQSQTGTFTLSLTCATGCAPAPPNDLCSSATVLDVAGIGLCSQSTGDNTCAYASGLPNPPCDPYMPIVDVWYRFETGSYSNFTFLASTLGAQEVNAALYVDCGSLEYVDCETEIDGPWQLNDLLTGSTYFIRLWNGGGAEAGTMAVCLETEIVAGISDTPSGQGVRLWPNPARERLFLANTRAERIVVMDMQGRTLLTHVNTNQDNPTLDVSMLAPGSYLVRSHDVSGGIIGRFIKE